jgi:hypothetical protein
MADHTTLRLAATLVLVGDIVLGILVVFVHPGGGATEEATLANYAASRNWVSIHLAQFTFETLMLAGLIVLSVALNAPKEIPRWLGVFGAIAAGVAMALAGVQYAVDGVANKLAVDAWASAPASDKAARFAIAEAIRWLEAGVNSYTFFMFGLSLVLLAILIGWTARIPRPVGLLMGVSGVAILVQGWLIATRGENQAPSPEALVALALGFPLLLVAMIWLLIVAWRMKAPVPAV